MSESNPTKARPDSKQTGMSAAGYVSVLLVGAYLGVLFIKSEVARWDRIHKMFLFEEAHMYLIISAAIVVAMISMAVIKRLGIQSVDGKKITYEPTYRLIRR